MINYKNLSLSKIAQDYWHLSREQVVPELILQAVRNIQDRESLGEYLNQIFNKAICDGDNATIEAFYKYFPSEEPLLNGPKCLHVAIQKGHWDSIKLILEKAKTEEQAQADQESIRSPFIKDQLLSIAAELGTLDLVKHLVEVRGAQVENRFDSVRCNGNAMMMACKGGHLEVLNYFLDKGSLITQTQYEKSAAIYAAEGGAVAVLKLLKGNGNFIFDPNEKDGNGKTLLMLAAGQGHFGAVKFLMEAGANCFIKTGRGNTALFFAAFALGPNQVSPLSEDRHEDGIKAVKYLAIFEPKDSDVVGDIIEYGGEGSPVKQYLRCIKSLSPLQKAVLQKDASVFYRIYDAPLVFPRTKADEKLCEQYLKGWSPRNRQPLEALSFNNMPIKGNDEGNPRYSVNEITWCVLLIHARNSAYVNSPEEGSLCIEGPTETDPIEEDPMEKGQKESAPALPIELYLNILHFLFSGRIN